MSAAGTLKAYYWLAKPGIIYGNLMAAAAGFFTAAYGAGRLDLALLAETAAAIALVIASACAFNNYIDRKIDKVMARTSWRALASGRISSARALVFASLLGVLGFGVLAVFCNALTFIIGVIAFVDYVVLYGWSKRRSWHGTLVGSVSGSAPLVAGYTALAGRFDGGAVLLFILMACWQMAHFYAIAIRRLKDYKAAGLPVLPAVKGVRAAKRQTMGYVGAFLASGLALYGLGYAGAVYLVFMLAYGAGWLALGIRGFTGSRDTVWAKKMFLYSLVFLPGLLAVSLAGVWVG